VLDAARKFYGLELPHARVIPNPIAAQSNAGSLQSLRSDGITVLFVGRFDRLKGGDVVLDAFNQVVERCPHAKFVFIGPDRGVVFDGTKNCVGIRDYISRRLSAGARRNVEWLGEQSPDVIEPYRGSAAVTVVASRFENFPYALIEAMCSGSPVVATRTAGIPEIVRDGETGLLVESENPGEMATAICRLLENREFASELGQNAAVDVATRFDAELVARQTLDFYGEVVARWKGRA
jgi:glycosyltransferase involved in cell wall biosynthesis